MSNKAELPTAILVHAAWFDGSSWSKVAAELQGRGHSVVAVQLPLTSFTDDVATLRRLLQRQTRPFVLVGHSYGGAVATAAGAEDPRLKSLVYISAIVPDANETVGEVFTRTAAHPQAPALSPDKDGFLWLDVAAFRQAVAPDATHEETALMAAVQKPINVKCLGEPMGKPAWREKPSWFLITEDDRMVPPATQRFTAERMKSAVVSLSGDHLPLVSKPHDVADLILQALAS